MSQCFSRIYGCVPCVGWAWCQERSDEGIGCPQTVVDGCEPPTWALGIEFWLSARCPYPRSHLPSPRAHSQGVM